MTVLNFRVDDKDAVALQAWAERLGVDRSELLRRALRGYLLRLADENVAGPRVHAQVEDGERGPAEVAGWGPAEDWSEWADAG